jgi:SAM-dependent methyltransferase
MVTRRYIGGFRRQDWAFFVWMFCAGGVVTALAIGDLVAAPVYAVGIVVAVTLARRWSRLYPAPMPYTLRWTLYLSHPGLSPRALHRVLRLRPGERMLEIGPGIGHHALPTAAALGPQGRLDTIDLQPEMLANLARRAAQRGLANIVAAEADAQHLPFADATFDAAYLVTVLGEVPNAAAALRELARVVKRTGRIVVGEFFLDPDYVSPTKLGALATAAGLDFRHQQGSRLSYFARLEVPAEQTRPAVDNSSAARAESTTPAHS